MNELLNQLIDLMHERTQGGHLTWTALDDDHFRTALASGSVMISESPRRFTADGRLETTPRIRVTFSNDLGEVIEQLDVAEPEPRFASADRLYRAARHSARRGKQVLTEMLHALSFG